MLLSTVADKTAVKAFWVALIVNLTREFCGCIAVLVYASHIFAEAGKDPNTSIALSPNKQSILLATVQIIGSFLACQLVDRVGRKVGRLQNDQLLRGQGIHIAALLTNISLSLSPEDSGIKKVDGLRATPLRKPCRGDKRKT